MLCAVRDINRVSLDNGPREMVEVEEINFFKPQEDDKIAADIDIAYYLIYSMGSSTTNFDEKEAASAENFNLYLKTQV